MKHEARRDQAREVRIAAADLAASRVHPRHRANDDEQKFRSESEDQPTKYQPNYLASFTKGMGHNHDTGLIEDPEGFQQFVKAIDSGDPRDFIDTPLGPKNCPSNPVWESDKAKNANEGAGAKVRAWESQSGGNAFDLEGPDAQAVTMPPAPALGSDELVAEMGEVYIQALLRDEPFTQIVGGVCPEIEEKVEALSELCWFKEKDNCCKFSPEEKKRRRTDWIGQKRFRGVTPGDDIGPYISQFLLAGTPGLGNEKRQAREGYIRYGAITIDQRVRLAKPDQDYMTEWDEWYDVQQGADLQELEEYKPSARRFITTPRDLATYVHYDALYQAYLNACLILLAYKIPFDPGIPFQRDDAKDRQQGFAVFGGPHILTLVTEVATRALKAVRFQKFNVHRRLRPEALAARLHKQKLHKQGIEDGWDFKVRELKDMVNKLGSILSEVCAHNKTNNEKRGIPQNDSYLLPMAFCEGSPMHPSYGAGHATVAGACVTVLKAFFDHKHPLAVAYKGNDPSKADPSKAFVPNVNGLSLKVIDVIKVINLGKEEKEVEGMLTVEGELNKLASNISIGRNWAGVHYFSDYIESIRMGEQIAIGLLEEQKLTYQENFSMTVPLFDGGSIRI